jgi:NTP pyrophosphatase (non-canonical NTP hydrolase)
MQIKKETEMRLIQGTLMADMNLKKDQIYQHYKGKFYKILNIGYNSQDDVLEPWIAYQGLYDDPKLGKNPVFFQSIARFMQPIDGKKIERFTLYADQSNNIHNDATTTVQTLKNVVENFVQERDWAQFHSPKNLSMALVKEATELSELFLWCESNKASFETLCKKRIEVEHEVADTLLILMAFANRNNIDLTTALSNKMEITIKKYPVEKCKGRADKYTVYQKKK